MRHLYTFQLIEAVARAGSIRKAAEDANITASALNRRIARFEEEFGTPVFERLTRGVRLNPAGELVLQHFRTQKSDLQRVQSLVSDLSGMRRGHVTLACSQALVPYFMPNQIARYRRDYPGVTFAIKVRDRSQVERELASFSSDLALVFEPEHLVDFDVMHSIPQPVCAVFAADHPLASKPDLRLRDCLEHPHILPATEYGVRNLLDRAAKAQGRAVTPVLDTESFELIRHYVRHEQVVGFQIPIGLQAADDNGLMFRELPERDVPIGHLLLGQLKGRVLPVATSRFAMQLSVALEELAQPPGTPPPFGLSLSKALGEINKPLHKT